MFKIHIWCRPSECIFYIYYRVDIVCRVFLGFVSIVVLINCNLPNWHWSWTHTRSQRVLWGAFRDPFSSDLLLLLSISINAPLIGQMSFMTCIPEFSNKFSQINNTFIINKSSYTARLCVWVVLAMYTLSTSIYIINICIDTNFRLFRIVAPNERFRFSFTVLFFW